MISLVMTLGAFAAMLVLARFKVPLAVAIILGSALLGVEFALPTRDIAWTAVTAPLQPMSIGLLCVLTLLLLISEIMKRTGQLEQIVSLAGLFFRRPAVTMAALPALIGLLPMPGGALFSAPMVHAAAGAKPVGGDLMSAINYWWRHIWEYWWPLYPGIILAMSLTQSSLVTFIAYQLPLSLGMVLCGLLLLRRVHPDLHRSADAAPPGTKLQLLRATSSIWIILAAWGVAAGIAYAIFGAHPPAPLPGKPETLSQTTYRTAREMAPLVAGMLASLIWTARTRNVSAGSVVRILLGKNMLSLLGLVVSVMMFQAMLQNVQAAQKIGQELNALRVPVVLVVIVLPFVAGMVTGLAFGFVGISFPIVLTLVQAMPDHPSLRPYAVLAYGCGHLGMMISPIHLCYVVSNQYFKTSFGPMSRQIALPAALMAAIVAGYFVLLRMVL